MGRILAVEDPEHNDESRIVPKIELKWPVTNGNHNGPDPGKLNFFEPRLVQSHPTVTIPFDDRVLLVSLLNCAELASRFSEIAQPLNAISGIQFRMVAGGFDERRLLGTVRVMRSTGV